MRNRNTIHLSFCGEVYPSRVNLTHYKQECDEWNPQTLEIVQVKLIYSDTPNASRDQMCLEMMNGTEAEGLGLLGRWKGRFEEWAESSGSTKYKPRFLPFYISMCS